MYSNTSGYTLAPACSRERAPVARARSKPVGRLAGTGDENLASASRCRPPDSRSKLYPAPLIPPRHSPPTFSLALFLARRAFSHSARAAFLDETFPAHRDTLLYHYCFTIGTTTTIAIAIPPPISTTVATTTTTTTAATPVAITFGASTFTSSNPTMCCLRRVSAELPSSFQIQPPSLFPSFHSNSPLRPRVERATLSSVYILRASFSTSPSSFTQLFPPNPTVARADDDATATYAVYIPRARLLPPFRQPPCYLSLFLVCSLLALGMRTTY